MGKKEVVNILVEGGKAKPGPSVSKLSATGVNIDEVFKQINEKTKEYKGIQIPVRIEIDTETKLFEIRIGTPKVSSLIKKELGIEKAKISEEEKKAGKISVGNLTIEKVVKIAKMKMIDLMAKDLKNAVKQVVGTANSMTGVLIEGKRPKEIIKEIDEGKWNNLFKD